LDVFFGFKDSGRFVDFGSSDGMHFDNSYAFEQRGWSGICIRTPGHSLEECQRNRLGSRCLAYSPDAWEKIGGMLASRSIDFLSVDLQPTGPGTLEKLDLLTYRPRVAVIATSSKDAIDSYCAKRGYVFARSLDHSHFYAVDEGDRRKLRAVRIAAKLS